MATFHSSFGWVVAGAVGLVGLWALVSLRRSELPRAFRPVMLVALGALVLQILIGVYLYNTGMRPGSQHMFYGFVILFTLTFAYVYRDQLDKRPGLRWGLLLLFTMGLCIRGIMTFGGSF